MTPLQQPNWTVSASFIRINGQALPLGGDEDVAQAYEQEQLGKVERALDGGLVFLGIPDLGFRINTTISVSDARFAPPVFGQWNAWDVIILECALPLYMPGQVRADDLIRPHVPGSLRYYRNKQRVDWNYLSAVGTEGMPDDPSVTWTAFRPMLAVMLETSSYSGGEFSKKKSWNMSFREHKDMRLL